MRRCYIVSYDISDDKRLRRVAKVMEEYGERIQYSVFRCELTKMKKITLESNLACEMNLKEDQVLFIDLGLVPGHGENCISSLGRAYIKPDRDSLVF